MTPIKIPVSSLAIKVDFVPQYVYARLTDDRNEYNRRQWRPVIQGLIAGSPVAFIPYDLGVENSEAEAEQLAKQWVELLYQR